jgi:nucleotide-binding universal stress UspA family protein
MLSSIVVGTDGSDTAEEAVRQAADLARRFDARLHIVCASTPVAAKVLAAAPMAGAWDIGPDVISEEVLAKAGSLVADASFETHAYTGEAADAILQVAEDQNADLIVVGNKGMKGAGRFLLGSVPNKVSHHAPCSVYIVRTS